MQLMVDAWLERREPVVKLVETGSRLTLAEWRGDKVRQLLDEGLLELDCLLESVLQVAGLGGQATKKFAINC